jgi:hypothetical protein
MSSVKAALVTLSTDVKSMDKSNQSVKTEVEKLEMLVVDLTTMVQDLCVKMDSLMNNTAPVKAEIKGGVDVLAAYGKKNITQIFKIYFTKTPELFYADSDDVHFKGCLDEKDVEAVLDKYPALKGKKVEKDHVYSTAQASKVYGELVKVDDDLKAKIKQKKEEDLAKMQKDLKNQEVELKVNGE